MDEKLAMRIALFRYKILAPALLKDVVEQKDYFAAQADKVWEVPHYGSRKFTPSAFKSWLQDYRKGGFDALQPTPRRDAGKARKIDAQLAERIIQEAKDFPGCSVSLFHRRLIAQGIINPPPVSESALRRFVSANDLLSKRTEPTPRKKYEKEHVNQLWIADFMYGPYLRDGKKKRQAILCDCIDDHSRVIVGALWSFTENSLALECTLKTAISRFGLPEILYADNGSAFSALHLEVTCARLGIILIHSKPYDSPSRGKIERFHRTIRDKFLAQLDVKQIDSIHLLNDHFAAWLNSGYHKVFHSGIGTTPFDRWDADLQQTSIRFLSQQDLYFAFYQTFKRKVKNDSTVQLNGQLWQVPPTYIGKSIEVRYPSDRLQEVYLFENNQPV